MAGAMGPGGPLQPVAAEHRADAIFALPWLPRRIALLGDPPGWRRDLSERDIDVVSAPADADLVVAAEAREALVSGARAVVVDGDPRAARVLAGSGMWATRLLPVPVAGSPVLFV